MTNNADQVKQSFLQELNKLIESAKKLNLVVEIKPQSKEPLAMGNLEMIADVREARESSFKFLSKEQAADIDNLLKNIRHSENVEPSNKRVNSLNINPPKIKDFEDVSFIVKSTSG